MKLSEKEKFSGVRPQANETKKFRVLGTSSHPQSLEP